MLQFLSNTGVLGVCSFGLDVTHSDTFLASQDDLEVMESVSHSVSVSTDLTDVTLVSDDTFRRLY